MIKTTDLNNQKQINNYMEQREPFIIRNASCIRTTSKKWSPEFISSINPNLKIPVKRYRKDNSINVSNTTLCNYINYLIERRDCHYPMKGDILYCHDIPMFSMMKELISDIDLSFLTILPKWYHYKWWRYVQFFMGPKGSWTPLHFDCLYTHNLFFQVYGKKRFVLIEYKNHIYLNRVGWRWFNSDTERPQLNSIKDNINLKMMEVVVNAGDILYMPPGTIHSVRGLEESISFNIDFHTPRSSLYGLAKVFQGMPIKTAYYNLICVLGLVFKIPSRCLFFFYRSYLNYIS
ncbi:MAG: hypothetical protein BGO67_03265 [Alphaproteobacteria bacterium 41-28]|nr:MAG: hypothetical protein BGO67_03265 [Alphaproteobacteria bacterium 41-28]